MLVGMSRLERLKKTLGEAFAPAHVEVTDDSGRHAGHAGARPGGETHYRVTLVSSKFAGLPRLERHRLVNDALRKEFASGLHALQLVLKTPEE